MRSTGHTLCLPPWVASSLVRLAPRNMRTTGHYCRDSTGIVYKGANLQSAAASHFLYDWLGLWALLQLETGAQWAVDLRVLLQRGVTHDPQEEDVSSQS